MHAASIGNFEIIKALIAKNVQLTSLSEETGQNCLMAALHAGKKQLIKDLSNYIVNVEAFN